MIAIPLEKKESTVISKLYGNTPYFAFLDEETGYFKVVKNIGCGDGIETAKFISSQKVDSTIFYHMGEKVYDYLKEKGLKSVVLLALGRRNSENDWLLNLKKWK